MTVLVFDKSGKIYVLYYCNVHVFSICVYLRSIQISKNVGSESCFILYVPYLFVCKTGFLPTLKRQKNNLNQSYEILLKYEFYPS